MKPGFDIEVAYRRMFQLPIGPNRKHLFVGNEYTNIVDSEIQPLAALAGMRFLGKPTRSFCHGASALLPDCRLPCKSLSRENTVLLTRASEERAR